MSTRDAPLAIDYYCTHCHRQLAVVTERHDWFAIKGLRDLVYVHAETGEPTCTVTYDAKPYDAWAATRAYEAAREAKWAAEDAVLEAEEASA